MASLDATQKDVNGRVRLRLYKGSCTVIGRQARHGLYAMDLATYGREDQFDHHAAAGFIYVWGLGQPGLGQPSPLSLLGRGILPVALSWSLRESRGTGATSSLMVR